MEQRRDESGLRNDDRSSSGGGHASSETVLVAVPVALHGEALTLRAIVIGILLCIGFSVVGAIGALLRYEIIGTGYLPRGVIFIMLLLLLINPFIGRFSKSLQLKRSELLTIFCMLSSVAGIAGQEYANHFYLNLAGLVYYSAPGTKWEGAFVKHIPEWLLPSTDPRSIVIRYFFEGLPAGTPIPWMAWLLPLSIWTIYFFLVYTLIALFGALIARQWEERERLLYPLTQVPLELVSGNGVSHLFLNPLMWLCFAFSASLYLIRGLHAYFPALPELNLQRQTEVLFPSGPLTVFNYMPVHIYPEMVGISYLLSREVAFSFWFFFLFRKLQQAIRIWLGINIEHERFFTMQTIGGYILLATSLLYTSRYHLASILKLALSRAKGESETSVLGSNPVASPRLLVFGIASCFACIWIWYRVAGIDWLYGLLTLLGLLVVSIVVARVVCEAGIFVYSSPFRVNQALFDILGTDRIGAKNTVMLTAVSWVQIRSTATMAMPYFMQCYKLGSVANINRKQLLTAMLLSIYLAILVCHIAYPYIIYTHGVGKLGWWPSLSAFNTANLLGNNLFSPRHMTLGDFAALLFGASFTWFLVKMRLTFLSFPFHPLGFVAWLGWPIDRYWLSIMIGWMIKVAVLRFAGYRAWYELRPAAYGLILGICFIITVWMLVHLFYPAPPVIIE